MSTLMKGVIAMMPTYRCNWTGEGDDIDDFMPDSMHGMMYRASNNGATPVPGAACW